MSDRTLAEQFAEERKAAQDEAEKPIDYAFTPYACVDPSSIPARPFLYEPIYIRKFTTGTAALGAIGKTGVVTVEALALATGLPLLGVEPRGQFRVVFWNGEDPMDELARSFAGARMHYGITEEQIGGRLFVDSGRTMPIEIARIDRWDGAKIAVPAQRGMVQSLLERKIDVLILDPFVSTHSVPENDNGAMDKVARTWNEIAEEANVSVHHVFHTTKISAGRVATAMNLRGAVAALNKLRYVRVLNRMDKKDGEPLGLDTTQLSRYLSADDSEKSNLLPPGSARTWFQLTSVDLGNADVERDGKHAKNDKVRVAAQWEYPDVDLIEPTDEQVQQAGELMGDKLWRKTSTSKEDWVGVPVAQALGMDIDHPVHKRRVTKLVKAWIDQGLLVTVLPEKGDKHNNKREGLGWHGRQSHAAI